jgi:hypothetical protein
VAGGGPRWPESRTNGGGRGAETATWCSIKEAPARFLQWRCSGRHGGSSGGVGRARGGRDRWGDGETGAVTMGFLPCSVWLAGGEREERDGGGGVVGWSR